MGERKREIEKVDWKNKKNKKAIFIFFKSITFLINFSF